MRAVESGCVEVVQLLLNKGAKINLRTKREKTALDIAYEWGNTQVIDLITASIAGNRRHDLLGVTLHIIVTVIQKLKDIHAPYPNSQLYRHYFLFKTPIFL